MTRNQYSDETKAAVMAALATGQGASQVAKEYKIPRGTVRGWKSRMGSVAIVATEKKEEIGDLLVDLITEQVITLKAQYITVRDPKWIVLQSASDMAMLIGVTTDKLIRMLESLDNSTADSTPES